MEMALGRMQRAEEEPPPRVESQSWIRENGAEASYSGEGISNRGLAASRGINRSPTDSSLRFLTYNRHCELWDFWDTDRRAAVMHFSRNTDYKIYRNILLALNLTW